MPFNITPPLSIAHLFENWLNRAVKCEKANIRVGVCAILTAYGYECGHISSQWSSARPWILDATVWRWQYEISKTDSVGGLIVIWNVDA
jgi:hypothetical protein